MASSPVEKVLGHTFSDRSLLDRALTHASYGGGQSNVTSTYQRLEFLGDRVLALSIATMLMERFPRSDEGELARRLNHLVRADTCADVARRLGLQHHVRTDDLDMRQETRAARAVLADVCEAVIAALYLDGGATVADQFIRSHWQGRMEEEDAGRRDPKTALQEWAHAQNKATPVYKEIDREGPDHAPEFTISVVVDGLDEARATGKSKRDAQQAAAQALLIREGIWT